MKIYTVLLPPGLSPTQALERAKLVKQGFDWEAFLVTPVWAIRHKLWLALGLWVAALAAIGLIATLAHLNGAAVPMIYWVVALAFGLESDRLRQDSLSRAGFLMHGLSFGASAREAELVYFAHRSDGFSERVAAAGPKSPPHPGSPLPMRETDLLGLFPSRESEP